MDIPVVRIKLRLLIVIMAVGFSILFLVLPLAIAVVALVYAPAEVAAWIVLICIVFAAILGYAMSSSYQSFELQGNVIRGRKLLTRSLIERPVTEIVRIAPLNSVLMGPLANAVMDAAMKTSNRGYELRFRDGSKLGLIRGDMANLDEFMVALKVSIGARWEEIVVS